MNAATKKGPRCSLVQPGRQRKLLTVALMLAMAVVALEGTVVTTALPTIVGELRGVTLYPWVFSIFLLTSTTSVPIYGKLADLFGRRPVFLVGLGLFLLGTALSGASGSMVELIAFRAVQGLGAGAVLPLTFTVLGDIYTIEERARVQALFSSVWGVLSLVGPAFGAFVTSAFSWRWVFLSNVPVIVAAALLLTLYLKERVDRRSASVDYAGAVTLTLGLVAVLLAVLEGGKSYPWGSWQIVGLLAAGTILLATFAVVERRAADPMIPFGAFKLRVVAVSNFGNLLLGVCMYGLLSYVPLFAQGVWGTSAEGASAVLTPMLLAWAAAAFVSGRIYVRFGFKKTALLGTSLIALGCAPFAFISSETPLIVASIAMGIVGLGFGTSSPAFLLGPQSAVPWNLRGAITSSTQFFRTIGGAVGVALMGALLNWRIVANLPPTYLSREVDDLVNAMLNLQARSALLPAERLDIALAIAGGLHYVFLVIVAMAAIGLIQVVLFASATPRPEDPQTVLETAGQQA